VLNFDAAFRQGGERECSARAHVVQSLILKANDKKAARLESFLHQLHMCRTKAMIGPPALSNRSLSKRIFAGTYSERRLLYVPGITLQPTVPDEPFLNFYRDKYD